jgi:hypothetical protein
LFGDGRTREKEGSKSDKRKRNRVKEKMIETKKEDGKG